MKETKDEEHEDEKEWKDWDNYQWRRWRHKHHHHHGRRGGGGSAVYGLGFIGCSHLFYRTRHDVLGRGVGLFTSFSLAGISSLRSLKSTNKIA